MNSFLAQIYNTAENIGAAPASSPDIEKMAEASLLQEMFDAEKVDVNKLDGQTIMKLAQALFGDNSALLKKAETTEEEAKREGESVAQEKKEEAAKKEENGEESMEQKVAEADFLGRVMAHSYVDELSNLEKSATLEAVKEEKAKQAASRLSTPQADQVAAPQSTGSAILDKLAGLDPTAPAAEVAQDQQIDVEKLAAVAQAAAAFLNTAREAGIPFDDGAEKAAAGPGLAGSLGKGVARMLGGTGKKSLAVNKALGTTALAAGGAGLAAGGLGGYAAGK